MNAATIEQALAATGELLAAAGEALAVVVVGGAGLAVLGVVQRVTNDVDVIALAEDTPEGIVLGNARPLPPALQRAASTVARDLDLPEDWLNSEVGSQYAVGLPPGMADELTWRTYAALRVGFAGRQALIKLKLFAATDHSPTSVHTQDLIALAPTQLELAAAVDWVTQQDASPEFGEMVGRVITHVVAASG